MAELRVRNLRLAEVGLLADWAALEGWNPGVNDTAAFFAQDPHGFLVGESDGVPVAILSAVRYGHNFAFIGFYIVAPGFRGQGHGLTIWREGMDRVAGRVVGLDGVIAQEATYRRSGFETTHRNIRYEGVGQEAPPPAIGIIPIDEVPWSQLLAADTTHFGCERAAFLNAWTRLPDSRGWARLVDGRLRGFGIVRRCRRGARIGPLFARTETDAEALFAQLAGFAPGEPLFLDTPGPNTNVHTLARRHGMSPVFETVRMYKGHAPALPLDRIYGITSFELG